jgi:hypothetical protein
VYTEQLPSTVPNSATLPALSEQLTAQCTEQLPSTVPNSAMLPALSEQSTEQFTKQFTKQFTEHLPNSAMLLDHCLSSLSLDCQ